MLVASLSGCQVRDGFAHFLCQDPKIRERAHADCDAAHEVLLELEIIDVKGAKTLI